MKIVVQRVVRASVEVDHAIVGAISRGLLCFVGIGPTDTEQTVDAMVNKILTLRLFPSGDKDGSHFDQSVQDIGGSLLLVSQFTLYADTTTGRRPNFSGAARPDVAEPLYEYMIRQCLAAGIHTETGKFGAEMEVDSINDGPVTLVVDL